MRKIIAWEGEKKIPGQLLEIGSLKWEEPLPVTIGGLHELAVAKATDIRREENGSVTAEIDDPRFEHVSVTIYCSDPDMTRDGDVMIVHSARIREIFMPEPDGVPW